MGLGQQAAAGEGTASAAAQGAADEEILKADQLVAVIKDAFKAGKAAVARLSTGRAPPHKLLSRRRQRQPEEKKVKRQPIVVTASARSALTRVLSRAERLEDPRYKSRRLEAVNQAWNSCSPFKFERPTFWISPSTPSGKAAAQDAAAGPETVRSHATQTTEHHMAALASDTGVASATLSHMFTAMLELVFNIVLLWGLALSV